MSIANPKEKQSTRLKPIYDPRRALEHLQTQNVKPVRLFAILFPLWDVETTATQEDGRPYELLEKYVERGIAEGRLHTARELATFFGLSEDLVQKILQFLAAIGHISTNGNRDGRWILTPLGQRSVLDNKKYVQQEKRLRFYFDAYTSQPLRTEHYQHSKVHILSEQEVEDVLHQKTWGYHFQALACTSPLRPDAISNLEAMRREDSIDYNVPRETYGLRALDVRLSYIPMYIIETKKQVMVTTYNGGVAGPSILKPVYLVYTGIADRRDHYLERIVNSDQRIYNALRSEGVRRPEVLWREWLDENGLVGLPEERPDGTWQISLPASAFKDRSSASEKASTFPMARIGDYELRHGYFMQIWCDDRVFRRKAALDRILKLVKSQQKHIKRLAILEQLKLQATYLQTGELSLPDLNQRATETNQSELIAILDRERP